MTSRGSRESDRETPLPTAALRQRLAARASIFECIRRFFHERDVLEVDTPLRAPEVVPEPHIQPLSCDGGWLLPSPERYLKPLLAAGSGDIYQLSHAFRAGETGRHHAEEFMLCEWYRLGMTPVALAEEVMDLIAVCGGPKAASAQWLRYDDAFQANCGVHPLAEGEALHAVAQARGLAPHGSVAEDLPAESWRDLLMSLCVQPALGWAAPVIVTHFPAVDSPLAQPDDVDSRWAQRFEVFWQGVELANGCRESCAPAQAPPADAARPEAVDVAAWSAALPDCAGVALGVDRLLMRLRGAESIQDVQPR